MVFRLKLMLALPFHLVYDDPPPEPVVTDDDPPTPPVKPPAKPKVEFTAAQQDYVNSLLAKEKRKGETTKQELVAQLEAARNNASTSEEDRERLSTRLAEIQNESKTKEQLAKEAADEKIRQAKESEAKAVEKSNKNWTLFQKTQIKNDILGAAGGSNPDKVIAYNSEQVLEVLERKAKLVPVKDAEGNPIPDEYETRIRFDTVDKDGKKLVLELSPPEAVARMAKEKKSANLFLSGATGGLGGGTLAGRGSSDGAAAGKDSPPIGDQAAYREWRKKNGPLARR